MPKGLPFKLTDYLELVELTGRVIRSDKRGYIDNNQPKILERLGIEQDKWLTLTTSFENSFKDLVGNPARMDTAIALLNRKRRPAIQNCQVLLA